MARKPDKLNLVMFAIDSLRADHMSCYGYPRRTTATFADRLAEEGTLVEHAYSAYIPTTPAYSSMLTGMDVMSTGMVSLTPLGPLPEENPTLAEVLKRRGYRSACVGFGEFYRGFDQYAGFESWGSWEDRPLRKAENLNAVTIPILDDLALDDKPFFLFLRHMEPHSPYLPPPPFDTMFYTKDPCDPKKKTMKPVFDFAPFADFFRSWMPPGVTDVDWAIASYDGEVAYMDVCQQVLFQRLEDLGVLGNTLIVYTSDHGETLYDHDCYFDHHGLYDQTLHIPLIFWRPGLVPAGRRVTGYTLQEDLMPTILDLLGFERQRKDLSLDGLSAAPVLCGERDALRAEFYITECTWMRKRGWRTPHWKYFEALEPDFHHKPKYELYDLVNDPGELHNLAEEEPDLCRALRKRMKDWVARRLEQTGKPDPILQHKIGLDRRIGSVATARKLQDR